MLSPPRSRRSLAAIVLTALAALAAASMPIAAQRARYEPEAASARAGKRLVVTRRHMIVAANPLAAEAGREILRAGGGAVDAAIAAQLVLGLVEPQSSGLGGGGFLLHRSAATREIRVYDGRETAPAAAGPGRFLENGRPMPFMHAVKSGLSVGVPGLLAMLELAHDRHGRLPWARLMEPALRLAETGFPVSPRLNRLLDVTPRETFAPEARAYFYDGTGRPRPVGHILRNPAYADTLRLVQRKRSAALRTGPIAEAIVKAVTTARPAGDLALADLSAYAAHERPALCAPYHGLRVCAAGPPSSGAHTVLQTLGMLARFSLVQGPAGRLDTHALHLVAEAEKLAFADRNHYLADPAFVTPPAGLLDPAYLARRARLIDPRRAMMRALPGDPSGTRAALGRDSTIERSGTTHLSIVDGEGNAVSLTSSIEGAFGSGLMAGGFLLNNQLTDFSFESTDADGRLIANRVEAGKRPRSSMTPTIILDAEGRLHAVLGSPGGSRIILYVVKAIVALVDWRLDAAAAAELVNFGSRGGPFEIEAPRWPGRVTAGWPLAGAPATWHAIRLRGYGHQIEHDAMTSGLAIVVRRNSHLEGGADPRREGVALGD
ncbi:MAG: gamma-glutamyltransferase family protein [Hyphomicrobiaceae bacterium]